MKLTINLDLDNEDDKVLAVRYHNCTNYYHALQNIAQYLRHQRKYVEDSSEDNIETIETKFYGFLADNNVNLYE